MKFAVTLATLALLCIPACDDAKDKSERPDLKPAKAKKDGDAAKPADAKAAKPAPAPGKVFFVSPKDGATVPEQFEVEFGVEGKTVRAAGATERDAAFGHHHLLIDTGAMDDMAIVPKDETHLHYGDGATKATVKLPPGEHEITMQFADGAHRSYGPDWAATIKVTVKAEGDAGADAAQQAPGG
ncbi:MAG: DUF4399 domain-containing protein [Myxococcota bacterium]